MRPVSIVLFNINSTYLKRSHTYIIIKFKKLTFALCRNFVHYHLHQKILKLPSLYRSHTMLWQIVSLRDDEDFKFYGTSKNILYTSEWIFQIGNVMFGRVSDFPLRHFLESECLENWEDQVYFPKIN